MPDLDLTLPRRITKTLPSAPVRRSIRLIEAEYQPLAAPHESELVYINFDKTGKNAQNTPSLRFLNGSLVPPNRRHEFVRNYEVQGLSPGLKIRVSHGELFSQFDVMIWLHLIEYMIPHNWDSCVVAKDLFKQRGIINPSGEDYILQKMSIMRFARTLIELSYTGKGLPVHFTGSLIAVGDFSAEGARSGAVYYDDLRAEKCGGDGYLGRLDRFSVHIRPEIAQALVHKELGLIVNINKQTGVSATRKPTQFESWLTYKLTALRGAMSDAPGYNISVKNFLNNYGSELSEIKFETMAKSAFVFVIANGWAGSYRFYTSDAGERRLVLSLHSGGADAAVNYIKNISQLAKKQAELRGDLVVSK